MKPYIVHFEGTIKVEAEDDSDAEMKAEMRLGATYWDEISFDAEEAQA